GVGAAGGRFEDAVEFLGAILLSPVEHHVLEEVADAGDPGLLVARADFEEGVEAGNRGAVVGQQADLKTVGQPACVDLKELLREGRAARGIGSQEHWLLLTSATSRLDPPCSERKERRLHPGLNVQLSIDRPQTGAQRAPSDGEHLAQLSVGESLRRVAQKLQVLGAERLLRRRLGRDALHRRKLPRTFSSQWRVDDQPSGADHLEAVAQTTEVVAWATDVRGNQIAARARPQKSVSAARRAVLLHHQYPDRWDLSADPRYRRQSGRGLSDRENHRVHLAEQVPFERLVKLPARYNDKFPGPFTDGKPSCKRILDQGDPKPRPRHGG